MRIVNDNACTRGHNFQRAAAAMEESEAIEDITGQPSTSAATISPTSRPLFTGRPRQSPVWQHFEYDATTCKSICQVPVQGDGVCSAEFSGKFTTNLKAHLKGAHPVVFSEVSTYCICVRVVVCMISWTEFVNIYHRRTHIVARCKPRKALTV